MIYFINKVIKNLALFFFSFIVIIVFVAFSSIYFNHLERTFFGSPIEWGSNYYRTRDLKDWIYESSEDKMLILGSSTSFRGLNPYQIQDSLNVNCFIGASSAQTIYNSYYILKYVISNTKIDYLILDIYPGFWNSDGIEATTDWVLNNYYPNNKFILEMILSNFSIRNSMQLIYFTLKRSILKIPENLIESEKNGTYHGKGFTSLPLNVNAGIKSIDSIVFKPISDYQWDYLIKIRELCIKENIILYFYFPPLPNNPFVPKDKIEELEIINAMVLPFQINEFYDNRHLKSSSVIRNTSYLINAIKKESNQFFKQ